MNYIKDEIFHFKIALQDVRYCWKKIVYLTQDLEYMEYELTGLARHSTPLTPEQEKSPLPMPRYNSGRSWADRIFEIDALKAEIEFYRKKILECETIERLSQDEKDILLDAFVFRVNRWDLAEKLDLCRSGLDKRINSIIKKCL